MSSSLSLISVLLLIGHVNSRHMPHLEDMNPEDRELWRAAYDAPAAGYAAPAAGYAAPAAGYAAPAYQDLYEDNDKAGKLDLLHDGLWALHAKVKELKAFDKALIANLLDTKTKVKDLLENHMDEIKKHHHPKPVTYQYQAPSYSYQAPSYHASAPSYSAPAPSYSAPAPSYSAPAPSYSAPAPSYSAPAPTYSAPAAPAYAAPAQAYQGHDPYYGH